MELERQGGERLQLSSDRACYLSLAQEVRGGVGKGGGKGDSGVLGSDGGGQMAISCHFGEVKGELGVGRRA